MRPPAAGRTATEDAVTELRELQILARADGLSFAFPLLVYGAAAMVSAPLLGLAPLAVYEAWWLFVALGAPPLILLHYRRRLRARGVGIGWARTLRYVYAGEALALFLWVQPYHPIPINAPWLAFALAAVWVARTWRDPSMYLAAAGVTVLVVGAAALGSPMSLTDLAVGVWLCGVAGLSSRLTGRLPAAMCVPFPGPKLS